MAPNKRGADSACPVLLYAQVFLNVSNAYERNLAVSRLDLEILDSDRLIRERDARAAAERLVYSSDTRSREADRRLLIIRNARDEAGVIICSAGAILDGTLTEHLAGTRELLTLKALKKSPTTRYRRRCRATNPHPRAFSPPLRKTDMTTYTGNLITTSATADDYSEGLETMAKR